LLIVCALALSTLALPSWLLWWLVSVHALAGHPVPILVLPFGPLLLLALLRWRTPDARLLLGLSIFPQLLFWYDQLPLWLMCRSWKSCLGLSMVSWVGYMWWRHVAAGLSMQASVGASWQFVMLFVYMPALLVLLVPPLIGRAKTVTLGRASPAPGPRL
jgi:hypothetical protein